MTVGEKAEKSFLLYKLSDFAWFWHNEFYGQAIVITHSFEVTIGLWMQSSCIKAEYIALQPKFVNQINQHDVFSAAERYGYFVLRVVG